MTNANQYRIRAAHAADAPALQRIYAECVGTADWLPAPARADADFARVCSGESIHVAIDGGGEVLGLVSVWVAESFVHHLYIAPEFRGRGLGGDLLAALEPWLAQPWRLKCVRANRHALAFYAAHGWREVGSGEAEQGPFAILEWQAPSPLFKPAPRLPTIKSTMYVWSGHNQEKYDEYQKTICKKP